MKIGETVYYVVSSMAIREAVVVRLSPSMCILRYLGGAISLPRSRVYATKEEAAKHVIVRSQPADPVCRLSSLSRSIRSLPLRSFSYIIRRPSLFSFWVFPLT